MISRRLIALTAAVAAVIGVPAFAVPGAEAAASTTSSAIQWNPSHRDYFGVPAAAMLQTLGVIPHGPCGAQFPPAQTQCQGGQGIPFASDQAPVNTPGLGVPLGGVGAGSFVVNDSGTFGPWSFGGEQDAQTWEVRALSQAAFHVREQVGTAGATVKTLATDGPQNVGSVGPVPQRSWGSPLPAWNVLQPGQGTYASLYPFGYMNYTPFKTDVSMQFFSPIVAGEDRRTSLPVAYFNVRLANHTGKSDKVSVMFTMPNAPDHVGTTPATVRTGLTSSVNTDPRTGVKAVTLSSNDPTNTPDAANSSWTIAARPAAHQTVSYTTSWNADGSGADVYAPFTANGQLPDAPIDNSSSAGAISVSATLQPGQVTTIPFAMSWDFPQVGFSSNQTVWMRHYTNFYGAKETSANNYVAGSYPGAQSFNIARDALAGEASALHAIQNWWAPIADNPAYPTVLRTSALNQLSQLVDMDTLWEGGLVSNSVSPTQGQRLGSDVPGTHLFSIIGSAGGGDPQNEMDTQSFGNLAYDKLFPNLERDFLRARIQATMLDPYGNPDKNVTHSGDPFITWPVSNPPSPNDEFMDSPNATLYRIYSYAMVTHDLGFLRYAEPAVQKTLAYLQAHIPPGSSLPTQSNSYGPSTYDFLPVDGAGVFNSELYLLSLEIGIPSAEETHDATVDVATLKTDLAQAKAEFEQKLWDPTHNYYLLSESGCFGQTEFLDSFHAEEIAEQLGLPDVVNLQHMYVDMKKHISDFQATLPDGTEIGFTNVPKSQQIPGVCQEDAGFLAFLASLGVVITTQPEQAEVWTGTNYFEGAAYITAGKRFHDPGLISAGFALGTQVANQVWKNLDNGYAFDPPEAYDQTGADGGYRYTNYARNLAVWQLLDAIQPIPVHRAH